MPPSPGDVVQRRVAGMLQRAVEERIPLSGSIAMTHRCQLRCIHCYLGDEREAASRTSERDTSFWLRLLDQAAEAGCLNLLITGGEPFLRDDFATVYSHAKRCGMLVTVFTNAVLLDQRTIELFGDLPPEVVEVTLYGASEQTYERVTGSKGSFERCLRGIDALRAGRIEVGLKAMILASNREEVPAMRQIATARGLPFRVDPALFPRRDGDLGPLAHRIDPAEAVALELGEEGLAEKTARHFARICDTPSGDRLFDCMAGLTSFHVDPDGRLSPCMMIFEGGVELLERTFAEGWRSLDQFREERVIEGYECHRCTLRFLCGSCPALAGMETGSPHSKSEYLCELGHARRRGLDPYLDK